MRFIRIIRPRWSKFLPLVSFNRQLSRPTEWVGLEADFRGVADPGGGVVEAVSFNSEANFGYITIQNYPSPTSARGDRTIVFKVFVHESDDAGITLEVSQIITDWHPSESAKRRKQLTE